MKTRLNSIPDQVPYLLAESHEVERWRERLGTDEDIKVGITWAGSKTHKLDRKRSLPAELLAPLGKIPGVRFISLQKDRKEEATSKLSGLSLTDWTAELYDLANTAALIANLDLVISVDTAVAHLAGAMGKTIWVLLPEVPDWRWMMDRDDSPWYPTMTLFRRGKKESWAEPIRRVVEALTRAACQA
jgi:ADP-heptose:LPS heptosyltransferase